MRVWHSERVPGLFFFFVFLDVALVHTDLHMTADTTLVHTQFQRYVYWYPATRYIRADTRYLVRTYIFVFPSKTKITRTKSLRARA